MRIVSRSFLRSSALALAVAGFGLTGLENSDIFAAAAPPAPAKADAQAAVPVRQVVLFSSGVGYFEHFGSVKGDANSELRFKTQQINDVLKSLVLQDLDKGKVGVITYPSQEPVARILRSFQVDITSNPALHELLNQLRGAKLTAVVGAERASGTVLGVEKKKRAVGEGNDRKVIDVWVLNLLTGASIRPVPLDDVKSIELEDPQLREELNKALLALATARDQDTKPVNIEFRGEGDRRVRIGYVVEAPVWKTSYRLLVDGDAVAKEEGEKVKAGEGEKKPAVGGGSVAAPDAAAGKGGNLQGWAIVENQTDNDWTDIQLSLVSGRPISFIQDLYQPLYVPRPVVQPELYASLRPQTYEGGIAAAKAPEMFRQNLERAGADKKGNESLAKRSAPGKPASAAPLADFAEKAELDATIDPTASVSSAASATKLGELFQYTVGSVSLPRRKSAMIPVVTDPVEVEKLSIYNQAALAKHPLYGARVKNTTGKHLLQGPVTVLQGGSYAGDARIPDLPPGQERLISYGIDLQVLVQHQNQQETDAVTSGKIVKGVLHLTRKLTASQDYLAENKSESSKTLVIEHPRRSGWTLAEPAKAAETTNELYRFKDKLEPNKPKKLTVREELVTGEVIAILPADLGQLDFYARTGPIPQPVKEALSTAIRHKQTLLETQRQIADRQQQVNTISAEQQRLRENMKTVAQNTDYYARLLKKLDEQETTIEKLQKEIEGLKKQEQTQRKALEDYLSNLNVG